MEKVVSSLGLQLLLLSIALSNPEEKRLLEDLFRDYNREVRPVKDGGVVYIDMSYSLVALKSINEKDQVANTFGWLQTSWTDEYLKWNKTAYGVDTLVIDADKIWLPDLIVRNSADNIYGDLFDNDKDVKYKIVLKSDGNVLYSTAGTASTLCSLDMTYFPYDLQVCFIHIDSWTYSVRQMKIRKKIKKLNVTSYRQNGIWKLLDTNVSDSLEDGSSQIKFVMYWQRYPTYHLASLVLPCSMMSFITLFVFLLPPDSGEKVSLSITVLLSFTVFQISVEEKMPERSDNRPLITVYILGVMLLTSLSLLCTIVVLMLHHQNSDDPPPHWLKVVALDWLGRIFFRRDGVVRGPGRVEAYMRKRLSDVSFAGPAAGSPEGPGKLFSPGGSRTTARRKRSAVVQMNHGRLDSERQEHQNRQDWQQQEEEKQPEHDVAIVVPDTVEMTESDRPARECGPSLSVDFPFSGIFGPSPLNSFASSRRSSRPTIFNFKRSRKTSPPSTPSLHPSAGGVAAGDGARRKSGASPGDCVKAILKKMMEDASSEELKTQWMRIALVCDRFFGVLFAFSLVIMTAAMFVIINHPPGLETVSTTMTF